MRKLILAAFAAAMIPAVALAQGFPGGGPGGGQGAKGPRMAQELGLTDAQVTKMREIHQAKRKATIDQKAAIQKSMIDLTDELAKEKPDQAALNRIIEKIVKTRADMERSRLDTMVAVSAILTPEQKKIAAERMADSGFMGGGRSGKSGMRPGGGGPGGGYGGGPGGGYGGPAGQED